MCTYVYGEIKYLFRQVYKLHYGAMTSPYLTFGGGRVSGAGSLLAKEFVKGTSKERQMATITRKLSVILDFLGEVKPN